jgi:twitching motility two-component system response regulator PilH
MSKKILIVDDIEANRSQLERIVTEAGHSVIFGATGEEAVERAQKDKPDMIFMDVNMPGMDGFAATRQLMADAATKHIPVVLVTARDQKADKAWGQIIGAKGYVTKPYQPQQILDQIKN